MARQRARGNEDHVDADNVARPAYRGISSSRRRPPGPSGVRRSRNRGRRRYCGSSPRRTRSGCRALPRCRSPRGGAHPLVPGFASPAPQPPGGAALAVTAAKLGSLALWALHLTPSVPSRGRRAPCGRAPASWRLRPPPWTPAGGECFHQRRLAVFQGRGRGFAVAGRRR